MKHALILHPKLSILAGGEFICLNVVQACRRNGWKVTILSDHVDLEKVEQIYGMSNILRKNEWIELPRFKPFMSRFRALQAIRYGRQFKQFIQKIVDERDISVIFSTQSSIYGAENIPSYHFCYGSPKDLFIFPFAYYRKKNRLLYDLTIRFLVRVFIGPKPVPAGVFANSKLISDRVEKEGYKAYPYCPPMQPLFKPRPKKKQVVMVSRFDRGKRLELFCEIARLVPEYPFVLICRKDPEIENFFSPGYAQEILANLPANVKFVPEPVRSVPWMVEESKAYIYTGNEAGIALVMNEGISAGCVPLAPKGTGNAEIIETLKVGYIFESAQDAAEKVRRALDIPFDPEEIAKLGERFSPAAFQELIEKQCLT
jgi:glycosyltransferase involved in cell wall biosynthesis